MRKNAVFLAALLSVGTIVARAQTNKPGVPPPANKVKGTGEAKVQANVTFHPVLQIELGQGAKNKEKDVVNLELNDLQAYKDGKSVSVPKQLKVFSLGQEYTVTAKLDSKENTEALYKVFQLGVGRTGTTTVPVKNAKSDMPVYTGSDPGFADLDATYSILPADNKIPGRIEAFNTLIGKDGKKKYTVDITYTIAAK